MGKDLIFIFLRCSWVVMKLWIMIWQGSSSISWGTINQLDSSTNGPLQWGQGVQGNKFFMNPTWSWQILSCTLVPIVQGYQIAQKNHTFPVKNLKNSLEYWLKWMLLWTKFKWSIKYWKCNKFLDSNKPFSFFLYSVYFLKIL